MPRPRKTVAKKPTHVHLVEEVLKAVDDFVNVKMLREATKLTANQVSASLHHLQRHRAAECVTAPDGLWWFATPALDTRLKVVEERAPEVKPRRTRRTKARADDRKRLIPAEG